MLPHPMEITLCDLHRKKPFLEEVRRELIERHGFRGPVHIAAADEELPAELYEQTTIIGATNAPGVLDIMRLGAGALLVDDSTPPCFELERAAWRFEMNADILFTNGGMLRSPDAIRETVFLPKDASAWADLAVIDDSASRIPGHITACVLASLISARSEELKPTLGLVETEDCARCFRALRESGFQAAELHVGTYALEGPNISRFQREYSGARKPIAAN
jgi:hypothetical protein